VSRVSPSLPVPPVPRGTRSSPVGPALPGFALTRGCYAPLPYPCGSPSGAPALGRSEKPSGSAHVASGPPLAVEAGHALAHRAAGRVRLGEHHAEVRPAAPAAPLAAGPERVPRLDHATPAEARAPDGASGQHGHLPLRPGVEASPGRADVSDRGGRAAVRGIGAPGYE
jgi:hypothetical protein